ncbi:MAG TPA: DUF4446 family protein [Gaiellaceae bacterium]|nr:DUF4446 family protein [Gaiellaceae bacterium]
MIAIAGVVVALAALAVAVVLLLRLRGLRSAQQTLISGGSADLVDFAVSLQGRIDGVNRNVDDLEARLAQVDRRVDGTVSRVAVVRYDAYENTGGHQSASVALLDASRTGVVLSAIQGRDYARIYVKELEEGRAAVSLSPEEQEAVDRAMKSG